MVRCPLLRHECTCYGPFFTDRLLRRFHSLQTGARVYLLQCPRARRTPMSDAPPPCSVTRFAEHVRLERHPLDARVATVVLDRPARRNAVDRPVAEALRTAFESFDADASLHAA